MDRHGMRPCVADISKEKDDFQIYRLRPPQYWNEAISAPQLVHHEDGEKTERRQHRGVRKTQLGKWGAEIRDPNKTKVGLGTVETAEEAARADDEAAVKYKGWKAQPNFPEMVLNSEALLDPNQVLHIGPPPHCLVVPTLYVPVAHNFNNVVAEMSSLVLINPTANYGHMDPRMSNISQQGNPSDVSPCTPTRTLGSTCYENTHSPPPMQLHQQPDEAGRIGSRNTSQLAELNEDPQTLMSIIVNDFTKWEESEQSSAQEPEEFWRSILANNPL